MNLFEHIESRVDCHRGSRIQWGEDSAYDRTFDPPPPLDSTAAMPGSAEKFGVLSRRVEQGESLWHPGDLVCFDHEVTI